MYDYPVTNRSKRWISIWSIPSLEETARLDEFTGQPRHLAFSPDGSRLASSQDDSSVIVWDLSKARVATEHDKSKKGD
jgi:WD40 repeat protein